MTALDRKQQQANIAHWRDSAARNLKAAEDNFTLGHNDWCLFIAHLAIEKLLKALIEMNNEKTPPKTHDLEFLAKTAKLTVPNQLRLWLPEITDFNLEARYDENKLAFYKRATRKYTLLWLNRCRKVYEWLENQLK